MLLVDADPQGTARTWGAVAAEGKHASPSIVAMGAVMHRPGQFDHIAQAFDLAFIDCPPRHGEIQRSALLVADVAILPCGPSAADAWAISASLELIRTGFFKPFFRGRKRTNIRPRAERAPRLTTRFVLGEHKGGCRAAELENRKKKRLGV